MLSSIPYMIYTAFKGSRNEKQIALFPVMFYDILKTIFGYIWHTPNEVEHNSIASCRTVLPVLSIIAFTCLINLSKRCEIKRINKILIFYQIS